MTNYFRALRGVRQGCPLSPLFFILCVEIVAQTICQNPKITGIELPFSCEVNSLMTINTQGYHVLASKYVGIEEDWRYLTFKAKR